MKDPAFLFYPGDYLRDTQTLSSNSQVAYDRIICEHMRNICISQQQLKFFTKRLSEDELEELMFVLIKVKGGYQIEWVAESIEKRRKYSKSRSENRKGKGKKEDNISTTYDPHMENESVIEDVSINKEESEVEIYPTFKDFWNCYDKKISHNVCLNRWRRVKQADKELIMLHVPLYVNSTPEKKFRKSPATYLNQQSWNDEIIRNNGNTKNRKSNITEEQEGYLTLRTDI